MQILGVIPFIKLQNVVVMVFSSQTLFGLPSACVCCKMTNAFRRVRGQSVTVLYHPTTWAATCHLQGICLVSIFGGWVLLCRTLFMGEDGPCIIICSAYRNMFHCGVPAGVSVLCDTAQALVFLLVSVCCDTAQVCFPADVSVLWHSPSLGAFAGVSVL